MRASPSPLAYDNRVDDKHHFPSILILVYSSPTRTSYTETHGSCCYERFDSYLSDVLLRSTVSTVPTLDQHLLDHRDSLASSLQKHLPSAGKYTDIAASQDNMQTP